MEFGPVIAAYVVAFACMAISWWLRSRGDRRFGMYLGLHALAIGSFVYILAATEVVPVGTALVMAAVVATPMIGAIALWLATRERRTRPARRRSAMRR